MSQPAVFGEADEMTLRDYAAVLSRRRWLVIVPAVIVTAVALAMSLSQTERYQATTDVLLREPPSATTLGDAAEVLSNRVVQNELQRAQGSAIEAEVREVVGDEPELSVRLAAGDDSDVFLFSAASRDPQLAADAADTYADTYIDARRTALITELQTRESVVVDRLAEIRAELDATPEGAEFEALVSQLGRFEFELESLRTSIALASGSGATVIDRAEVPSTPFEPTPARTAALALVVGLLLGLGIAFLADYLDNSLRNEEDMAKASGLPVIGVIPKVKGWEPSDMHVITRENPTSPTAEAYRALRTAMQFLSVDRHLQTIQVTSPKPGDGKTTTATNLAVAFARAGKRTLLIDGDLRRPRVHHSFSLTNEVGFTSAIAGAGLAEVVQKVDGEPNLSVITSGPLPPDPSELLSSQKARALIDACRGQSDLLIIDSPPVLVVSDPLVIASSADGVILVASAGETDRRQVERAAEQLAQVNAPAIGAVLNSLDADHGGSYSYRYTYGQYDTDRHDSVES